MGSSLGALVVCSPAEASGDVAMVFHCVPEVFLKQRFCAEKALSLGFLDPFIWCVFFIRSPFQPDKVMFSAGFVQTANVVLSAILARVIVPHTE